MSEIEKTAVELTDINSGISALGVRIQREEDEITETMNKVMADLGDQPVGQKLAFFLQSALKCVIFANRSVKSAKEKMCGCMQDEQK